MEGVCLEGGIEIAVIVGVILLGVGWKAEGCGRRMYQSRPIQQQQEIGAAAHRWMDAKELACAGSAVHVHGHVCVSVVILHTHRKFVGLTGRPTAQLWLREGNQCSNANTKKEKKKKKRPNKKANIQNRMI